MKRFNKTSVAGVALAMATAGAASATPTLSLEVTDGTANGTISHSTSGNGSLGLAVNGSIDNFVLTFNVGTSTTIPSLNLSTTDVATGTGSITVFLTYSNLTTPLGPNWSTNFGTSISSGVETFAVKTFLDPANSVFTTNGAQLASMTQVSGGPGKTQTGSAPIPTAPYSITEELIISAGANCTANNNCNDGSTVGLANVPEPSTIALLGFGLLGLGLLRRTYRS